MKTLYFDCSSGISGNMTLGALTEIIGDEEYLIKELEKLKLDGYQVDISKKVKNGITGTYVDVILTHEQQSNHIVGNHHDNESGHTHEHSHNGEAGHTREHSHNDESGHTHEHSHSYNSDMSHTHDHNHEHNHHGPHLHRNLEDINKIIDNSTLSEEVKQLSKRIFMRVARAESKVHNRPLEEVHFHEVGAIDSIVDIVGTAILINRIKPDRIISGTVNDGYGFIECAHGKISVPVPATSEIFSQSGVKFRQIDIDTELVTPTGAAIIAELADEFTYLPEMTIEKIGWGTGTKDLKIPNVLKVYLGDMEETGKEKEEAGKEKEEADIVVMETNIDDCQGEILGYIVEKLLNNGARDVFYTPIFMKKNRPAYRLTVVCMKDDIKRLQSIIFKETTTIGIRYRYEHRTVLERQSIELDTKYGTLKAKKVMSDGEEYIYPEFESAKTLAEENALPLKEIYKLV